MKTIIHNTLSLDGSYSGFPVDMGLHYSTAAKLNADAYLIGSKTAVSGLKDYSSGIEKEVQSDFEVPKRKDVPYWVVVDSTAALLGKLHMFRRFEYCRDVVVLVSEKTSKKYLDYLKARNYGFIIVGTGKVDLHKAFPILQKRYKINTFVVDSGPELCSILVRERLADEFSILLSPVIASKNPYFKQFDAVNMKLISAEIIDDLVWIRYRIEKMKKNRK